MPPLAENSKIGRRLMLSNVIERNSSSAIATGSLTSSRSIGKLSTVRPSSSPATAAACSGPSAVRIAPALPRPPTGISALTTTLPPSAAAASATSSAPATTRKRGTATPPRPSSSSVWCSRRRAIDVPEAVPGDPVRVRLARMDRPVNPGRWQAPAAIAIVAGRGTARGESAMGSGEVMFEGFAHRRIQSNGVTINLRQGGNGPPLLLLHGNPLTHVSWHKIAPRLAEDFTVVASDLRGYGDSDKPRGTPDHAN